MKELKVLLLSVSQQFHPLPAVEGNLADLLSRTYIPRDLEEGPNVSKLHVDICMWLRRMRCVCDWNVPRSPLHVTQESLNINADSKVVI